MARNAEQKASDNAYRKRRRREMPAHERARDARYNNSLKGMQRAMRYEYSPRGIETRSAARIAELEAMRAAFELQLADLHPENPWLRREAA